MNQKLLQHVSSISPKNCRVSKVLTLLWHSKNYCHWCRLVFSNGSFSWGKRKYLACPPLVYFLLISSFCWFKCEYSAIQHQSHKSKFTEDGKRMMFAKMLLLWRIWQLLLCHLSCSLPPPSLNFRIRWTLHLWQCSRLSAGDCQK